MTVINHVGQCVSDLARSRRFYEALGFTHWYDLRPGDTVTGRLLGLEPPLGLECCYLYCGDTVLELMAFSAHASLAQQRAMDHRGLTHLSLCVQDVEASCALVLQLGGEVLTETNVGAAIFVCDPDGQLIELLAMAFRDRLPPREGPLPLG